MFARANVDDGCYVLLGLMYPEDGMKKLRQMEMQTGIWTMRVQLMIDGRDIVVIDRQTSVRTRRTSTCASPPSTSTNAFVIG